MASKILGLSFSNRKSPPISCNQHLSASEFPRGARRHGRKTLVDDCALNLSQKNKSCVLSRRDTPYDCTVRLSLTQKPSPNNHKSIIAHPPFIALHVSAPHERRCARHRPQTARATLMGARCCTAPRRTAPPASAPAPPAAHAPPPRLRPPPPRRQSAPAHSA